MNNVLIVNGSPHTNGCTARALREVEKTLNDDGISTSWIDIGVKNVHGCISCFKCREIGKCVFDDIVNQAANVFEKSDGILVGSPTYYAGISGGLKSFLDRLFFSSQFDKNMKVGAAVISSRRAGSTSVFDDINKYFTISSMPIVSSTYWNEVHGYSNEDVEKDLEGLQTMRNLGRNMAFLIKCINLGKEEIGLPDKEYGNWTNFADGL